MAAAVSAGDSSRASRFRISCVAPADELRTATADVEDQERSGERRLTGQHAADRESCLVLAADDGDGHARHVLEALGERSAVDGLPDRARGDHARLDGPEAPRPLRVLADRRPGPCHRRLAESAGRGQPLTQARHALILIDDAPGPPCVDLDEEITDGVASEIDGGEASRRGSAGRRGHRNRR